MKNFEQTIKELVGDNWASNSKSFEKLRFTPVMEVTGGGDRYGLFGPPRQKSDRYTKSTYTVQPRCELRKAGPALKKRYGKDWVLTGFDHV